MHTEGFGLLGDRDERDVTESDPRLSVCIGVVSSGVFVGMFWLSVFLVSADGVPVFGPLCVCTM